MDDYRFNAWYDALQSLPEPQPGWLLGPLQELWDASIRQRDLSLEQRRTSYWSLRLMLAMDDRDDHLRVPGWRFTAFGFLDPETEVNGFGAVHVTTDRGAADYRDLPPV